MEAAFSGESDPVTVITAPEKEIRSGYVEIHAGFANVFFSFQWDDPTTICGAWNRCSGAS